MDLFIDFTENRLVSGLRPGQNQPGPLVAARGADVFIRFFWILAIPAGTVPTQSLRWTHKFASGTLPGEMPDIDHFKLVHYPADGGSPIELFEAEVPVEAPSSEVDPFAIEILTYKKLVPDSATVQGVLGDKPQVPAVLEIVWTDSESNKHPLVIPVTLYNHDV